MVGMNGVEGTIQAEAQPPPLVAPGGSLPPLIISGFVVTKADLLRALAVYVPHLVDISTLDDTRFVLRVDASGVQS